MRLAATGTGRCFVGRCTYRVARGSGRVCVCNAVGARRPNMVSENLLPCFETTNLSMDPSQGSPDNTTAAAVSDTKPTWTDPAAWPTPGMFG